MPETNLKFGTEVVVVKQLGTYSTVPIGTIGIVDDWNSEPVVRIYDTKYARVFQFGVEHGVSVFEFVVPLNQIIHEWIELQNKTG